MRRFGILAVCLLSALIHCPSSSGDERRAAAPIEAFIVWNKDVPTNGIGNVSTLRVVDPQKLSALAEFFPNYTRRSTSRIAAQGKPDYEVYFTFADGETIRAVVSQNESGGHWSVGHGSISAKGNFSELIDRLIQDQLVGTWEFVSPGRDKGYRVLKHLTRTNFIWSHNNLDEMASKASASGTWSLHGGVYKEHVDFATDAHKHLRGKDFTFAITIDGDKWFIKAARGSGLVVDEVWKKVE
jgi:hypothetical protein